MIGKGGDEMEMVVRDRCYECLVGKEWVWKEGFGYGLEVVFCGDKIGGVGVKEVVVDIMEGVRMGCVNGR